MNEYQEAIERIKTIDLDVVLDKLGYNLAEDVSIYGIHDYPNLEMSGDIKALQELVGKATPKLVKGLSITHECLVGNCPYCGKLVLKASDKPNICSCGQKLKWNKEDE